MKKSELKTGMLVVHNDGKVGKVMLNTKDGDYSYLPTGSRFPLYKLMDDLNFQDNTNPIIKVYEPKTPMSTLSFYADDMNLIWEGTKVKYIKANHFGSQKDYFWKVGNELDLTRGDIVEVETSKGPQIVQVKDIYNNIQDTHIHKKVIRKVVI